MGRGAACLVILVICEKSSASLPPRTLLPGSLTNYQRMILFKSILMIARAGRSPLVHNNPDEEVEAHGAIQ